MKSNATSQRQSASPLTLVREALGGPRQIAGKLRRIGTTVRLYLSADEVDSRLRELTNRGLIDKHPTRPQLIFGGLDMLRFLIEPAARDYYQSIGISFGFHQLLRVLDDPVSMMDPTGFLSAQETIVGHLMQVVHLNPIYDMQLIQMFPDGLEDLERQVEAMVAGTHPRRRTIGAIIEDPDYHRRLLDYIRRFRENPTAEQMPRDQGAFRDDPHADAAERTFATLPGFIEYASKLPTSISSLVARLRAVKRFPLEQAP